jgi:hypothetical protein
MCPTIHEADLIACRVASSLTQWVAVVLDLALRDFQQRAWSRWGFSSKRDFCIERLGVSSGQFELWVEAGRMFSRFPRLRNAVLGDDGGTPLGLCKGRWVGKYAEDSSLKGLIELARARTSRQLQLLDTLPESEEESRARWSVPAPESLGKAFEAELLLHRKLSGGEAAVTRFVGAWVAEAMAQEGGWDEHLRSLRSTTRWRRWSGCPIRVMSWSRA